MADEPYAFRLTACRELMDSHPDSLVIRQQGEALETPLVASEALFRTDINAYRAALVVFRQEQEAGAGTREAKP